MADHRPELGADTALETAIVRRFVETATDALAAAREEVDALNVYPVPDGDTGTNMFLTFSAARDALLEVEQQAPVLRAGTALAAFARGALMGARGNSGVILSELLGAFAARLSEARPGDRLAQVMAEAMKAGADAAYRAVAHPVEGTMLTVARSAAEAAMAALEDPEARSAQVFSAAAAAAREALLHTPEQLAVLAASGVVDAGGRGLTVVLDSAETVFTGRRPPERPRRIPTPPRPESEEPGPAYEVMYLLDADAPAVDRLRTELATLGDSLVVVGREGLWNVHVHVDDAGAAVEAGVRAGRPHRIRVTHLGEQVAARARQAGVPLSSVSHAPLPELPHRIVAVAAGPGLGALFAEAGAVVVSSGVRRRPSAGEILDAIIECASEEVVVLPNDHDSVLAAEIAARTAEQDHGVRVAVIPTRTQVQGLAALAVHETHRGFDRDILEMTATARHARHGAITVAASQAMTMGGPCEAGDVLGVVDGDFVVVGSDLVDIGVDVLDRLLGGGGELVTIVAGEDGAGIATALARHVEEHHTGVDVMVYDGGQERYPVLLGVE